MTRQPLPPNQSEFHKKTVNRAVRICVNCGNIAVSIENHGVFCKDCGSFCEVEKEKNE